MSQIPTETEDNSSNNTEDTTSNGDNNNSSSTSETNATDDTSNSGDNNTDSNDPGDTNATDNSTNDDPNAEGDNSEVPVVPEQDTEELKKKIAMFKNMKNLYNQVNNFITKIGEFNTTDEKDNELILFINDTLNKTKENIRYILLKELENLEFDKLKTLFIYFKSEITTLIKIFEKIVSHIGKEDTKKSKSTKE